MNKTLSAQQIALRERIKPVSERNQVDGPKDVQTLKAEQVVKAAEDAAPTPPEETEPS
jgi:hypothetical protein